MAQFINMYPVDLAKGAAPIVTLKQIHQGNHKANRVGAIVTLNGEPLSLGGTCSGTAIRADGYTVPLTGTINGNEAYVELESACYAIEGVLQVYVTWLNGNEQTTLLAGVGTVHITDTGAIIQPGTPIPNIEQLLAKIADMEAATAEANSALDSITNYFLSMLDYARPAVQTSSWELGGINSTTGNPTTSTILIRTGFYAVSENADYVFTGVTRVTGESYSRIRFIYCYDKDFVYIGRNSNGFLPGTCYVRFTYGFTTSEGQTVAGYGGVDVLAQEWAAEIIPPAEKAKNLKILVVGNSFSQNAFAYLPPILNEILGTHSASYGVAYNDSTELHEMVELYDSDTLYDRFMFWGLGDTKWTMYSSLGTQAQNGKTLQEIIDFMDWDIIYLQSASNMKLPYKEAEFTGENPNPAELGCFEYAGNDNYFPTADTTVQSGKTYYVLDAESTVDTQWVTPARQMLRILQGRLTKPFKLITGSWLGTASDGDSAYYPYYHYTGETGDTAPIGMAVSESMLRVMDYVLHTTGFQDYIPLGIAFQNARTVPAFRAVGDSGNLLQTDGRHMQAGLPALIAAYTIALKILGITGNVGGIYASTFVPPSDSSDAYNFYRMVGGTPTGIDDPGYIRAAQEVAAMAIKYPDRIMYCGDMLESDNAG